LIILAPATFATSDEDSSPKVQPDHIIRLRIFDRLIETPL